MLFGSRMYSTPSLVGRGVENSNESRKSKICDELDSELSFDGRFERINDWIRSNGIDGCGSHNLNGVYRSNVLDSASSWCSNNSSKGDADGPSIHPGSKRIIASGFHQWRKSDKDEIRSAISEYARRNMDAIQSLAKDSPIFKSNLQGYSTGSARYSREPSFFKAGEQLGGGASLLQNDPTKVTELWKSSIDRRAFERDCTNIPRRIKESISSSFFSRIPWESYVHAIKVVLDKEWSGSDINFIGSRDPLYKGFCLTRELNEEPTLEEVGSWLVLNLDVPSGGGTHWVGIKRVDPESLYYFDSFAIAPPSSVIQFMNRHSDVRFFQYNSIPFQLLEEKLCGPYVVSNLMN